MARYKNGINGPFSGKVGTVVGASWRGIDYMRSVQKTLSKPASPAQINQRLVFALVTGWLQPLRDLIWIGFQVFKGPATPMNGCVALVMKEAVVGDGQACAIDFPAVIFSKGELLPSWILEVLPLTEARLQIKWENAFPSVFNRDTDQAVFVVYNPAKEKFITFTGVAVRGERITVLQLSQNFSADMVHCYQFYVSLSGDMVSTSQYLGAVTIG